MFWLNCNNMSVIHVCLADRENVYRFIHTQSRSTPCTSKCYWLWQRRTQRLSISKRSSNELHSEMTVQGKTEKLMKYNIHQILSLSVFSPVISVLSLFCLLQHSTLTFCDGFLIALLIAHPSTSATPFPLQWVWVCLQAYKLRPLFLPTDLCPDTHSLLWEHLLSLLSHDSQSSWPIRWVLTCTEAWTFYIYMKHYRHSQ